MMDATKFSLILFCVIKYVHCHGVMVEPSPWFDFEGKSGETRKTNPQFKLSNIVRTVSGDPVRPRGADGPQVHVVHKLHLHLRGAHSARVSENLSRYRD